MKTHKIERNILEMFDKDNMGRLIRIFQVDTPEFDNVDPQKANILPVYVTSYGGMYESIVSILEERKQLREQVRELGNSKQRVIDERLDIIEKKLESKKKWYQFWIK